MRVYRFLAIFFVLFISSCGSLDLNFDALESKRLRIVSLSPENGEMISSGASLIIKFSKPIYPESLNENSIGVVFIESVGDEISFSSSDMDDLNLFDVECVLSEGGFSVQCGPVEGAFRSGEYRLIISNNLISEDGMMFLPGEDYSKNYVSWFFVEEGGVASFSSSETSGDVVQDPGVVAEEKQIDRPENLVINEIFYDVVGSDTNGDVFIELSGSPGGCLDGFSLVLINGDDGKTYKAISIPENSCIKDDGIFLVADIDSGGESKSECDLCVNFDPQNGPDAIQLLDHENNFIDAVGYGNLKNNIAQNGFEMFLGSPASDVSSGQSLSRLMNTTSDSDNSSDFVINEVPSPGLLDVFPLIENN